MKTWKEVSVHTGQEIDEDAPANAAGGGAIAGLGVDHPDYPGSGEPGKKKKKNTLIDGRSKAYKEHRKRLEAARIKRQEAARKSKFVEGIVDDMSEFGIEDHIEVDLDENFQRKIKKFIDDIEFDRKRMTTSGQESLDKLIKAKDIKDARDAFDDLYGYEYDRVDSLSQKQMVKIGKALGMKI